MYRTVSDFLNEWSQESESTLKIFSALTDSAIDKKPAENVRAAGRLAWHITTTPGQMLKECGYEIDAPVDDNSIPQAAEISSQFKKASENLEKTLSTEWNDKTLEEQVNMYGQTWTKEQVLNALMKHMIHHRGQLTTVMRLAGLKVPGIYGPAREEWAAMGMEPQN